MDQETAVNKILKILIHQTGIPIEKHNLLEQHLMMLYGIGFDEGRKQNAHGKPVGCFLNDILVEPFPDITTAANKMKVHKSTISKAVIRKTKCCSYYWKYI